MSRLRKSRANEGFSQTPIVLSLKKKKKKIAIREIRGKAAVNSTMEKKGRKDFPSHPVVKILCFHCAGHGFNPWPGN